MADTVMKPDVVLDGQEFSAVTRMLEALHQNKDVSVDESLLKAARDAHDALKANEAVVVEDLGKLHEAAKAYQQAVADELLGQFPSVKGEELKKIVKKLEGLAEAEETVDEDGNKVHPAALPAGDRPVEKPSEDPTVQKVQIVDPPKDESKPQDQEPAKADASAPEAEKVSESPAPAVDEAALKSQVVKPEASQSAPEQMDTAAMQAQEVKPEGVTPQE